jgi:uncharacterized Ntn-hydrolase superfamily protein
MSPFLFVTIDLTILLFKSITMKTYLIIACLSLFSAFSYSQDTFSIVAVDSVTGEVGSAGASCVDLFQTILFDDSFLGKCFPGEGAINTQAAYLSSNQGNATTRFNAGDTPSEIIQWLMANDVQGTPETRQYGIVRLVNGSPESAAHTGTSCFDYKNHVTGPNYSIQGNILLSQEILDSMEARFNNAEGDLACKLMAALQGANIVGADTRCSSNGTSSLFAFVKVAQPTDAFGSPSFKLSVRTHDGAGIEPIDSLQTMFDAAHSCQLGLQEKPFDELFNIFPNPTEDLMSIHFNEELIGNMEVNIIDLDGKVVITEKVDQDQSIDLSHLSSGSYQIRIRANGWLRTSMIVKI